MLLSLERGFHVGAFVFFLAGAVQPSRLGKRRMSDRGRRTCADGYRGCPETWEALLFPRADPAERPEYQLSAFRPVVVAKGGTKQTAATRGTAERREPKRGGMNNRESERSDSTDEVGELALSEDPVEGSGTSHQTTDVGNYVRCLET